MILVTGATGTIGNALLPLLLERGEEVRAMVRDPRRLGPFRISVQLALADLGNPHGLRHAMRGADTVIHLAGAIRDQPPRRIEEINGIGTVRLIRAAEAAGVRRFVFASALNASEFQRTRFFRSKAFAERAVRESELETTILAPSIVYDVDDPWITLMRRLTMLPAIPVSGAGRCDYEPIWARDVARCIVNSLEAGPGRYELAGPEVLNYREIARTIASANGRDRPIVGIPLPVVRTGLIWLRRLVGQSATATWEEAELMEVPMVSERGTADANRLGVEPRSMTEVLAS